MAIIMKVKQELQKIMDEQKFTHPLSPDEKKFVMNAMDKLITKFEEEQEDDEEAQDYI